jgi:hypothetical protein
MREYVNSSAYAVSHDTCTNSIVIFALILPQIRPEMRNFRLPPRNKWELGSSGLPTFGTNYRCHLQESRILSWPLKMGRTGCPETSVRNYRYIQNIGYSRHLLAQYGLLHWRPFFLNLEDWGMPGVQESRGMPSQEKKTVRRRRESEFVSLNWRVFKEWKYFRSF